MAKKQEQKPVLDALHTEIKKDDFVVYRGPGSNRLAFGIVEKVNPLTVSIRPYPYPTPESPCYGRSYREDGIAIKGGLEVVVVSKISGNGALNDAMWGIMEQRKENNQDSQ